MTVPEYTQIFTLTGVILSLIIGAAGLMVGIKNSRKTIFINSVTTARLKYIQDLRNAVSEFCGLFYSYHKLDNKDSLSSEKFNIIASSDKLRYLIILLLNPEDTEWDTKIIELIDEIMKSFEKEYPTYKINELIAITQYLLKLEWEGAKLESQNGEISKEEKLKLYQKYLKLYEVYKINNAHLFSKI